MLIKSNNKRTLPSGLLSAQRWRLSSQNPIRNSDTATRKRDIDSPLQGRYRIQKSDTSRHRWRFHCKTFSIAIQKGMIDSLDHIPLAIAVRLGLIDLEWKTHSYSNTNKLVFIGGIRGILRTIKFAGEMAGYVCDVTFNSRCQLGFTSYRWYPGW